MDRRTFLLEAVTAIGAAVVAPLARLFKPDVNTTPIEPAYTVLTDSLTAGAGPPVEDEISLEQLRLIVRELKKHKAPIIWDGKMCWYQEPDPSPEG